MKEVADEAVDRVGGLDHVVVVDYTGRTDVPFSNGRDVTWEEVAAGSAVEAVGVPAEQVFGSTGETWNPEPWWWLFREVGKERIPIVNLSGGTEIGACILSANLLQGIKPVALGGPSLGMAADVVDGEGVPLRGGVG
ncbi:hypothetical protein BH23ACT5_BH23ACT5_03070 [soil metagenome]